MSLDLDRILEKKGLNRSSLSAMLGKSRSYVQNIMKNPTLETLESIAEVLNVEVRDLFSSNKDKTKHQLVDELKRTLKDLEDKI